MTKTIILALTADQAKLALLDQGKLVEVLTETPQGKSRIGDIYVGQVTESSRNFVFLTIGSEKVFLNQWEESRFKVGDKVRVQVRKDPVADKLAYVSTDLNLVSRYLVLSKTDHHTGGYVSSKIPSGEPTSWLKPWAKENCPPGYGLVLRTEAQYSTPEQLKQELAELLTQWEAIDLDLNGPVGLRYHQNSLAYYEAALRVLLPEAKTLVVNDEKALPALEAITKGYDIQIQVKSEETDLFEAYEIPRQLEALEKSKVWLKTGGYVIIEPTTAMTVIDVNSGKSSHRKKDVILKVNQEAATEIARQMRLRQISGIVVVDFINMDTEADTQTLLQHFKKVLKQDRVPIQLLGMTQLGLCELTRKRTR